jgi:hypothetical protein
VKPRDSKLTNPKDAIGSDKLPLHLVPDTLVVFASLGFLEGALKYGQYNWRVAGVRLSIYWSALERHRIKFCAGEWCDPTTQVPHLASMVACLAIILDAHVKGKLRDDRPPANLALSKLIDGLTQQVKDLKVLFKDHHPHQYTRDDDDGTDTRRARKGTGRRPAKAARRVLPKARAERDGLSSAGLSRVSQGLRVRRRDEEAGRSTHDTTNRHRPGDTRSWW